MKAIIAAIHGIMTNQTDPSWPDKFDAWMYDRDPEVKVVKKEYRAGPFPRWNCWVKDPRLAASLANELELFLHDSRTPALRHANFPPLWLVAHSNGAVIALLATKRLIGRGYPVAGLILTGAACEADIYKNQIFEWYCQLQLGAAISYSSKEDLVLAGDARARTRLAEKARDWFWGKLMWPYGCLGRTGWLAQGSPLLTRQYPSDWKLLAAAHPALENLFTRWCPGGHSTYFTPENLNRTFEQIYQDIHKAEAATAETRRPQRNFGLQTTKYTKYAK